MLNDVSASLHEVAAAARVPWVAMHMQGEPGTMQARPDYDDVVAEVARLPRRAGRDRRSPPASPRSGSTPASASARPRDHNLACSATSTCSSAPDIPVLIGTSRKRFLGALTGDAPEDDRLEGTIATCVWAVAAGVKMVRVHDVAPAVEAMRIVGEEVLIP